MPQIGPRRSYPGLFINTKEHCHSERSEESGLFAAHWRSFAALRMTFMNNPGYRSEQRKRREGWISSRRSLFSLFPRMQYQRNFPRQTDKNDLKTEKRRPADQLHGRRMWCVSRTLRPLVVGPYFAVPLTNHPVGGYCKEGGCNLEYDRVRRVTLWVAVAVFRRKGAVPFSLTQKWGQSPRRSRGLPSLPK